jgi:alpha-tubulin suppressor-like RCC1 family protein
MKAKRSLVPIWLLWAAVLQAASSGAQPVTQAAGGGAHSLFLKGDGSLWGMGFNGEGELGDGTYGGMDNSTNRPEQIVSSNVTAIAAGFAFSLFLKNDGSLWGMGYNDYGQLGLSDLISYTNRPVQIVASNVTAVAAGWSHTLFLQSDGSLWTMGQNLYGQLGDGTTNKWPNPSPRQIVASNVTAIAAGYFHSLFLKNDGSLWGMGWNAFGGLGDGTYNLAINQPEQLVTNDVTAMAAGWNHSLFVKRDGSLWAMGYGGNGELGDGTYNQARWPELIVTSNVTAVAVGNGYSLFLKCDGSLWTMGIVLVTPFNTNTNRPTPIVAGGVTAMARGYSHYLFVKNDGSLWGTGDNAHGRLGDGTYTDPNQIEQILAPFNQISGQLLSSGDVQLSFEGIARANYALDRSFSMAPPDWVPQSTNPANSFGALVFTNTPNAAINNFWRIRSVP